MSPSGDMLQNSDNKVIIIGAGPAGLTAAYEICRARGRAVLIEKDKSVGGLAKTIHYRGCHFDTGGHRFFTKFEAVKEIWREVLDGDLLRRKRLSRIYYRKKLFHYPLRTFNALFGLGLWNCLLVALSYLKARVFPEKPEKNFAQWVSNRFGKRLYKTFFETYTEKVWGIPCSEISAEWAAQRIKGLSLLTAVKNVLIGQNGGRNESAIKTLIDSFDYPRRGPGMMWEAVADRVQKNGGEVRLGAEVRRIFWRGRKLEAVAIRVDGQEEQIHGAHFISSMPIRELVQKFEPAVPEEVLRSAMTLKYRDFLTVALLVNKPEVFPDNWIYVHGPEVRVGRVQNYKNWSPDMVSAPGMTCLGLEYFCSEGDELWTMLDRELIELAKQELSILGLVNPSEIEDGTVVRVPKAYPVYDSAYEEALRTIRHFLSSIENLQLVGRNGRHRYNNQDHSMVTAMMAVENLRGANHDLWSVNEEEEYHEEVGKRAREPAVSALQKAFARMDQLAFAAAVGTVSGLGIFLATLWVLIKGGEVIGPNLQLLGQYFTGYTVTARGAFIGLGYGFAWGFLFGWLLAYFRNFFLAFFIYRVKRKAEMLSFRDFLDHF